MLPKKYFLTKTLFYFLEKMEQKNQNYIRLDSTRTKVPRLTQEDYSPIENNKEASSLQQQMSINR